MSSFCRSFSNAFLASSDTKHPLPGTEKINPRLSSSPIAFWIVFGLIWFSDSIYWVLACLFVIFGYIVEGGGFKRGIGQGLYTGYCAGREDEKNKYMIDK